MAAPAFRSEEHVAGAITNSITINKPAGTADGDLLVAYIIVERNEATLTGLTAPSGWTFENESSSFSALVAGQEGHVLCYTKRASGEGASWQWTWTNSGWREGIVLAYSGGVASGDFTNVVSGTVVNSTSVDWSDTTTADETTLVFGLRQFSGGTWTGPGNERYDGGGALELAAYDDAGPATAGATGTKTFTSVGSGQLHVVGVALMSVAVVGAPKAILDWRRNVFPFVPGDTRRPTTALPSSPQESGGPSAQGGFERYIFPRLHAVFAATAFEIAADPAAFTLTGADAGLIAARLIDAQPGTFTLTGVTASLVVGYSINAAPGSFTLTGVAAGLTATRLLNAAPGTFAVTGTAAGLLAARILQADPGTFTLTAAAATLVQSIALLSLIDHTGSSLTLTDHSPGTLTLVDASGATLTLVDASATTLTLVDHTPTNP